MWVGTIEFAPSDQDLVCSKVHRLSRVRSGRTANTLKADIYVDDMEKLDGYYGRFIWSLMETKSLERMGIDPEAWLLLED